MRCEVGDAMENNYEDRRVAFIKSLLTLLAYIQPSPFPIAFTFYLVVL
jgi:hypothetical protein